MKFNRRRGDHLPAIPQGKCAIRFALTCLLLSPLSILACHLMLLICPSPWVIIAGIALCVLSVVLMIIGHRKSPAYLWTVVICNTVATGISLSAFFAKANGVPGLSDYSAILVYGMLLLLSAGVFGPRRMPKVVKILFAVLIAAIPVGSVVALFCFEGYAYFFAILIYFNVIWAIQTVFLYLASRDTEARLYNLAFASFNWYAIITFIVLFALTEGKLLESCDCSGCDCDCDCGSGKRRKR